MKYYAAFKKIEADLYDLISQANSDILLRGKSKLQKSMQYNLIRLYMEKDF